MATNPRHRRPQTPPSQIIKPPTTPPGAPLLPAGNKSLRDLHDFNPPFLSPTPSPTESELFDFLTFPPFSASQVQCVLWFFWTTTAKPHHIANIQNRAFSELTHTMTQWDVVNIEHEMASHWNRHGGSFTDVAPMSLLGPPGDNNRWSCLCDFGVKNCWDYKRDKNTPENLEKLSMARTLWDATPKQMVRCPHGRERPEEKRSSTHLAPVSRPYPLQSLRARPRRVTFWAASAFMVVCLLALLQR